MSKNKCEYSLIRREERKDEENSYLYELMMRLGDTVASFRMPLYSIRVNMTDRCGNVGSADVCDAFTDEDKAICFFDKLVRNLTTPIDLSYIFEDEMLG